MPFILTLSRPHSTLTSLYFSISTMHKWIISIIYRILINLLCISLHSVGTPNFSSNSCNHPFFCCKPYTSDQLLHICFFPSNKNAQNTQNSLPLQCMQNSSQSTCLPIPLLFSISRTTNYTHDNSPYIPFCCGQIMHNSHQFFNSFSHRSKSTHKYILYKFLASSYQDN